jgi:proteasome accessory factor A
LVLDLIEDGYLDDSVILQNPVGTFKSISRDQDWKWQLTLADGRTTDALDHQEMYLDKAKQHYSTDPVKKAIIQRWEYVLHALRQQDIEALADKLDHVIKKRIIERTRAKHGWDLTAPGVRKIDLRYHSINPDESIYLLMEKRGYVDTLGITDDAIQNATQAPPTDTRAYFRGKCIEKFPGQITAANWDLIDVRTEEGTVLRISMEEPLKGTARLTGDLIERSPTIKALLAQL